MNAKEELLRLADGELIIAILLDGRYCNADAPIESRLFEGEVEVRIALKTLDFEFDSSYGLEEGCSLYAWTKTKVIVKGTYDGAEWYLAIPRNPTGTVVPESIGG